MPVLNGKNETIHHKKQRRWSLIGILSKKKKFKKSQESVDFYPYDGKFNQKVAQNDHLERSTDCFIEQYTCSPRLIRRCNSLQYTRQVSACSNNTSQPTLNAWKSSQQSVYSSNSSACYSDIGAYKDYGNHQTSHFIEEENEQTSSALQNVPFRCSSEIGNYQNKTNYNQRFNKPSISPRKLIGKKIPPPPPPRDPNIKAVYYYRNNRLMSRESDSTYFSLGSDDNIPDKDVYHEIEFQNKHHKKEPPRSRRPIQICDVETLSTESESSAPARTQTAEEALQELEDIYNSLGLNDEDLLDRAERRDLPTLHQNMRYQSSDELDCVSLKRILPKTRRSGVPDIISDDMAYRRLNKRVSKQQSFVPGSFLLVLPTVYNLDKNSKPSGEPDITLDDVVYRSRRQHLNFLKIPDPQPPFGIPLGPIVGAASSDYLHAVPEGRYKPSFHSRKMPDTVEDDWAFRNLRKDNKYKTCIDFSFVHSHRNRFKIDNLIPRLIVSNKIRNDTHWIIKKVDRCYNRTNNNQVKHMFDDSLTDSISDDRQNLMVVKINHHKPIVLTGFSLNEANQLGESIFRTNLLHKHEPRKLCLSNETTLHTPANSAPLLKSNSSQLRYALNANVNVLPVAVEYSSEIIRYHHANNNNNVLKNKRNRLEEKLSSNTRILHEFTTNVDDGLKGKHALDGKNQPNFRELIKREYALRYPMTENRSSNRHTIENIKYRHGIAKKDFDNTVITRKTVKSIQSPSIIKSKIEGHHPTEQDTANTSSSTPPVQYPIVSEPSRNGASSSTVLPNHRLPGSLEVCLYIIVYIYQLYSVNAYSTLIALVFLIALQVCRRLS